MVVAINSFAMASSSYSKMDLSSTLSKKEKRESGEKNATNILCSCGFLFFSLSPLAFSLSLSLRRYQVVNSNG
jgi:hypothetical protein